MVPAVIHLVVSFHSTALSSRRSSRSLRAAKGFRT